MGECEYMRKISAAHDGELSAEETAALHEHLEQCSECRQEMERLQRLSSLLGEMEEPGISSAQLSRLHNSVPPLKQAVIVRLTEKMALVAAVILMACVIGLWKMGSATASEEEPPAQWESAAIASAAQSFADASEDELMAQWIIKDLSEDKVRD